MTAPEPSKSRGGIGSFLTLVVVLTIFVGAGYGAWKAHARGETAFQRDGAPYLDALVAGDWAAAAALGHAKRPMEEAALRKAWEARQQRFGDLTGWELHTANPGWDPDGEFVRCTVKLTFAARTSAVPVRMELRSAGAADKLRVFRLLPTSPILVWD